MTDDGTLVVDRRVLEDALAAAREQIARLVETMAQLAVVEAKLAAMLSSARPAEPELLLTLKEFAFRKGITCEAARKRAQRGGGRKIAGVWYVPCKADLDKMSR